MKVRQMLSPNSQRPVANQFIITDDDRNEYFQSYETIIAKIDNRTGEVYLDINAWNYSRTTSKYRNEFLRESTKETQKKIDSGEYTLINLNA